MRLRYSLLLFPLLCAPGLTRAGNDPTPAGARAVGLGNAAATLADGWSITNNVGGLGWLTRGTVGVYAENRFNVSGFRTGALAAALPLQGGQRGVAGVEAARFGDDIYSETRAGLGYAYRQGPFSIGLKADLLQYAWQGLASRRAILLSAGGVVRLLPKLWFGAAGYNLNQAKLSGVETDERVPTQLKAGLSYRPSEKVLLNVETQKQIDQKNAIVGGAEYAFHRAVAVRAGFNSLTEAFAFGVSGRTRDFALDYALVTHPVLGLSHHVGLSYSFGAEPTPATQP